MKGFLGLGYIFVGPSEQSIDKKNLVLGAQTRSLDKAIGRADISIEADKLKLDEIFREMPLQDLIVIDCVFKESPIITTEIQRMEAILIFPIANRFMAIILPKAKVEISGGHYIFTAMPVDHPPWKDSPFGQITFK